MPSLAPSIPAEPSPALASIQPIRQPFGITTPGSGTWTAQSLGTLGGVGSDAFDINSAGNVVGYAARSTEVGGTGAFIWHPGDASVTDLDPSQDFGNTFASGINDNNVVVGSDTNGGAFVWDSAHGMRNLQDLIDPSAPYFVTDARDVNDNGWIIGTATNTNDNLPHAIIFKPISQILPGDYNRDQHVNAADIATLELALTNLLELQKPLRRVRRGAATNQSAPRRKHRRPEQFRFASAANLSQNRRRFFQSSTGTCHGVPGNAGGRVLRCVLAKGIDKKSLKSAM